MPLIKRRRRNSGELRHLRTEVWASLLYLAGVVEDDTADIEHRLKAAHGVVVTAGVYRNILEDVRGQAIRHEAARWVRRDDQKMLPAAEDEGLDEDLYDEAVSQAMAVGTIAELEQARQLFMGLPEANKALVQAMALATIGRPPAPELTPAPPKILEAVIVPPDPEEARLLALEHEVRSLIHGIKAQSAAVAAAAHPARHARG
jgi:hypothetical protein